jgi:hypothetical protein
MTYVPLFPFEEKPSFDPKVHTSTKTTNDVKDGQRAIVMDDLIIFSNSAEDHQKHLTRLLEVLSKEKIHLSIENVLGFVNTYDS